ncbi:MAG TPA: CDP-alcohol phosphatidyltransferase family protein [Candidatus Dormibacteraeota bacterium]|nr:CDP-alcohol phosphatidyltransferase family protein [Candidatus Dormibacteraeota bacterium]
MSDEVADATTARGGRVVEGEVGVAALRALFVEAFATLRAKPRLRRSLAGWTAAGLVVTVVFAVGVGQLVSPRTALFSGLGALGWFLVVEAVFVGGIPALVTPEGAVVDHYGWPNGLSAVRAWSCMPLVLCASLPLPGRLSLILWLAVGAPIGLLDFVDGWIARRFGPVTQLGKAIDPGGDAVYFTCAGIGNVLVGIVPVWMAVFLAVRYVGPLLGTPIVFFARRRPELVHTEWGRRNTFFVGVVLITEMFVKILGGPTDAVALALGIPLLVTTAVLHFVSLGVRMYHAPVVRPSRRERREERRPG